MFLDRHTGHYRPGVTAGKRINGTELVTTGIQVVAVAAVTAAGAAAVVLPGIFPETTSGMSALTDSDALDRAIISTLRF